MVFSVFVSTPATHAGDLGSSPAWSRVVRTGGVTQILLYFHPIRHFLLCTVDNHIILKSQNKQTNVLKATEFEVQQNMKDPKLVPQSREKYTVKKTQNQYTVGRKSK